jgi:DNA-binding transcriptional regulator YdaS (Cro superfamily)
MTMTIQNNSKQNIQHAIDIVGGQTALAHLIGVGQGHIWNWLNRDDKLPLERALAIERATRGKVTVAKLRPDLY